MNTSMNTDHASNTEYLRQEAIAEHKRLLAEGDSITIEKMGRLRMETRNLLEWMDAQMQQDSDRKD